MSAPLQVRAAATTLAAYRAELASASPDFPPGPQQAWKLAEALGGLLAALDGAMILTPQQAEIVGQALDDAKWSRVGASAGCTACDDADRASNGQQDACPEHAADAQQADAYAELGLLLFGKEES